MKYIIRDSGNIIRELETLNFNGKEYTTRTIKVKSYGEQPIAGVSLEEELFDKEGNYVSGEARLIDEGIFFYVEDKWLNSDDEQLSKIVEKGLE